MHFSTSSTGAMELTSDILETEDEAVGDDRELKLQGRVRANQWVGVTAGLYACNRSRGVIRKGCH